MSVPLKDIIEFAPTISTKFWCSIDHTHKETEKDLWEYTLAAAVASKLVEEIFIVANTHIEWLTTTHDLQLGGNVSDIVLVFNNEKNKEAFEKAHGVELLIHCRSHNGNILKIK